MNMMSNRDVLRRKCRGRRPRTGGTDRTCRFRALDELTMLEAKDVRLGEQMDTTREITQSQRRHPECGEQGQGSAISAFRHPRPFRGTGPDPCQYCRTSS